MVNYIIAGLCLTILCICILFALALRRMSFTIEFYVKQRHYLEKAFIARGLSDDYRQAFKESLRLWVEADAEPRIMAEAEAQALLEDKARSEARLAKGELLAAQASATPEAQAKRLQRVAKRAGTCATPVDGALPPQTSRNGNDHDRT